MEKRIVKTDGRAGRLTVKILAIAALVAGATLGGCGAGHKSDMSNSSVQRQENSWDAGETEQVAEDAAADDAKMEGESGAAGAQLDAADSASAQNLNEKRIYTYNYSVETKAFDTFMADIVDQVKTLGGYVENSETNGSSLDGANRYANMTLRIPADRTEELLAAVREKSNVVYDNVSSENVTLRYVDMESHLKALRTEQKTLLRLIKKADKVEDVIALQSQLTQVRYEIESYESQLRAMGNLVDYSTVYLDITEVERTTTVPDKKATFAQEAKNLFSDNVYALGQWLRSLFIWMIGTLPILAPLLIVAAIVLRQVFRWGKKRRIRRNGVQQETHGKDEG